MSIKSISKINNYGIFKNFNNTGLHDYGKYNLFYGWNGCGKSTLSTIFYGLGKKAKSEKFPQGAFSIVLEDGATVSSDQLDLTSLNIHTFNQEFIDQNIAWNSVVKKILLIDEGKIKEREELESKKKIQKTDREVYEAELLELTKINTSIQKFGTDSARHIKASLQSIDTSDRYYLNYDKRKFESFIEANKDGVAKEDAILDEEKLLELTNAAKPIELPSVSFVKQEISDATYEKARERLDDLLGNTFVSETIDRLTNNPDIKSWVETGLALHKTHNTNSCEFCGEKISEGRIRKLEGHFNDSYRKFQERIEAADKWLADQYITTPVLPAVSQFYDELKSSYLGASDELQNAIQLVNKGIELWHGALGAKRTSPLNTNFQIQNIDSGAIGLFNEAMAKIDLIVKAHNHKSANFEEETAKSKKQLELHYAATEIRSFGYQVKKKELFDREAKNNKLKLSIDSREKEIIAIESSLANESIGADKFNEALHKFLGRTELTLRFNQQKKGYEIIRNNSEVINGQLSEGEKTAIAFVYFVTKIKENDNKIEDSVIVVDDPVSSFDSNHLFHSYSFLRSNCEKAKQLFVFTHNFTYFKLVRDWFEGVNKGRRRKEKEPSAYFFSIESSGQPRHSEIKNASTSLIHYNSEYHYIFSRLKDFAGKDALSRDDAFLTANLARKLLESFFSFKYPKHRSDIAQLMDRGLKDSKTITAETKEKIYRFINKYSHSAVIEINEDSSENLFGESQNVINDIFNWVNEVDEVHFKEMLEVANEA